MSSEPPPVPITDSFNLRAWIQNTVLSLATANTLYLSKRIADTAQGIITFLSGIKTDSINPTTTTGILQIGHNATNSNVEIASQVSRSTVLHLGDGNTSSGAVHINNGVSSTGNTRIMNGTTQSGELTLGGSNSVVIALNRPLTAGYSYLTASGTVGAGSTGVGKIGQIVNFAYVANTAPSGIKAVMGELVLTQGLWILTGNFNITIPSGSCTFAQISWWLGGTQYGITDYSPWSFTPRSFTNTTVVYASTVGTYQLKIEMYYSGVAQATAQNTGWNISALRIA
jgi:hypothetical protein